jgi:DNA-binding response OmpR family regulator
MPEGRILIVEDDLGLAELVGEYLTQHGFAVESEARGDTAVDRIVAGRPDLVVLDLMLPGLDGLTVCRRVRPAYRGPILMLTARGEETDEVVGLELGADDYLAKPVRPRVLLARVRALLRRQAPADAIEVGGLRVDPGRREASFHGQPVELTSGELDLLILLAAHAGQVVDRATLYKQLRGVDADEFDRSIDLRVSRLRQKLAAIAPTAQTIKTVRGVGYLYVRS